MIVENYRFEFGLDVTTIKKNFLIFEEKRERFSMWLKWNLEHKKQPRNREKMCYSA
ncbi:hypothetical protein A6A12_1054 [Vibrio anguillarum]|nr:hypothetical protein A6A12_1054 [Vibrio anguillarum]